MNRKALYIYLSVNLVIITVTLILLSIAIINGTHNLKYYLNHFNIINFAMFHVFFKIGIMVVYIMVFTTLFGAIEKIIENYIFCKNDFSKREKIFKTLLGIIFILSIICMSLIFLIFPHYVRITEAAAKLFFYLFWIIQGFMGLIFSKIILY
ncbi:MAG: hypothetical protein FWD13_09295 [Treponema sp.]|nr:hypothetical protein [Treponema sp.]